MRLERVLAYCIRSSSIVKSKLCFRLERGGSGLNKKDQEWIKEQQRVDHVIMKVKQKKEELRAASGEVQKEIIEIRRHFWDDVTVNLEDRTEAMETATALRQQAEVLSERERRVQHASQQVELLNKLEYSPYFGRIDFQEEGSSEQEQIYLGLGSFYDEEQDEFLIYDWRAPISSLYYDASPGPATYETPAGTINGTLQRKRQFVIKNGKIESLFDTGVTIGDKLLQEILGKQSDAQMKSIVATIQREQNQIIRNHHSNVIIVQGVAGSGKTSAALQRVAYLLYRHRGHLRPNQMILFSPNPMFNSYISTVLPELGEENILQTTFQEYLEQKLGKAFRLEDPYDQMECILGTSTEDNLIRRKGIRYKASQSYLDLLETYLERLTEKGMMFQDICFRGKTYLSAQAIETYFYGLTEIAKIPNRLEHTKTWILNKIAKWEQEEQHKPWVEEEINYLDKETYNSVYRKWQKRSRDPKASLYDYQEALAKYIVRQHFAPLKKGVKQLAFVDFQAIYQQLFHSQHEQSTWGSAIALPKEWEEICRQTYAKIEKGELYYEDATPYLYLQERLKGFETNHTIRHLLIDEAQDYSPFQFAVLRRLFPRSKITILGDFSQAIFPHAEGIKDPFASLSTLFQSKEIKRYDLLKSYRSTKEIIEFARQIVKEEAKIIPFERHGAKPILTIRRKEQDRIREIVNRIDILQKTGRETIAILCKTEQESNDLYQTITQSYGIKATKLHKYSTSFQKGVVILPSYLAKGIEFDAVMIADASQYQDEWERKLFYTACTRAMHELYLYAKDHSNPFLCDISTTSYIMQS